MALENLLTRLIAQISKHEARNHLFSNLPPPSYGDVLHDGLVGSGKTLGGILGATTGYLGGQAIGGARAGIIGSGLLEAPGALAGGWAGHGVYREGQLIGNILSHPENWTVDAAGAIVPVVTAPNLPSASNEPNDADARYLRRVPKTDSGSPQLPSDGAAAPSTPQSLQNGFGTIGQSDGAPPIPYLSSRYANPLGDGMGGWQSSTSDFNSQQPAPSAPSTDEPGGLLGMLLDHLRKN